MISGLVAGSGFDFAKTGLNKIGNVLGIGSNRGSKRDKRDKFRDALKSAGVRGLGHVHSDDWAQVKQLAQFVQRNKELGIAYLNEQNIDSFGGTYGQTAQQVLSGWSRYKSKMQSRNNNNKSPNNGTGTGGGVGTGGGAGTGISSTMLLIAAGIAALFFFGRNKQGAA